MQDGNGELVDGAAQEQPDRVVFVEDLRDFLFPVAIPQTKSRLLFRSPSTAAF
jgi:hypothetical protein